MENGFRTVGPSQTMMDYGRPLFELLGDADKNEFNGMIHIAQLCWNLALSDDEQMKNEIMNELQPLLKNKKMKDMIDYMIDRHHQMFPTIKQDRGFYICERVIDDLKQEDKTYFDESSVNISDETIPPDKTDRALINKLILVENSLKTGNEDYFEKHLPEIQDRLMKRFEDWCLKKGVIKEQVENFCFTADRFLDFIYSSHAISLAKVNDIIFKEIMTDFWIRKTWAEAESITAMLMALKLFYQFLKEKEFLNNDKTFQRMINHYQTDFLNNYQAYQKPV